MKTAVIIGAGVGGVVVARRLRRLAPRDTRIVVIDRDPEHVFAPSLLWIASGDRSRASITRPLSRLARRGIEFIKATVSSIDVESRIVRFEGGEIAADALIIALGATTDPRTIPGLNEYGIDIYTADGVDRVDAALRSFSGGSITIMTAEPLYKCPAAPYELAFLVDHRLRRAGVRSDTTMTFLAAEAAPMATAGPAASDGLRAMLAERAIEYRPGTEVREVTGDPVAVQLADGSTHQTDLLFFVPAHRPPAALRALPIAGPSGWISVDRETLETDVEGVWAIGDAVAIPLENGRMLPKAGVFAHAQAEVVARNIAAEWSGRPPRERFDGHGTCFVEVGGGRAAAGVGNFYASPEPSVRLDPPGRWSHLKKVLFEKLWLGRI